MHGLLCRFRRFNDTTLTTSSGNKYDYIVWRLMFTHLDNQLQMPVIVLETKHRPNLQLQAVAQAISYYAHANKGYDKMGVAMLLNEYERTVQVRFILFPYTH